MKKLTTFFAIILISVTALSCGDKESNSANEDLCPDNPNKTKPGNCGCHMPDIDSDTDGILDCVDSCPYDSNKISPGVCGCHVMDVDSDSDALIDCIDPCIGPPDECDDDDDGCDSITDEICNDIDDDCDGKTDEDWPLLGQQCFIGSGECAGEGIWQCKSTHDDIKCSAIEGTGVDEICDGIDNNCDGETDEAFPDLGNGCYNGIGTCRQFGNLICSMDGLSLTCDAVPGQPANEADFSCDGLDHNCDGLSNNGIDEDEDGYEKCTGIINGVYDCNDDPDGGASVHPDQLDMVGDGEDTNCDGIDGVDQDQDGVISIASGGSDCDDTDPLVSVSVSGYIDLDNDTYGDENAGLETFCTTGNLPNGYVYSHTDCNDNPALGGSSIFPGASETCNAIDNNCSGDESDASDLGSDLHCTVCFDDCTLLSYMHSVDPYCSGTATGCSYYCEGSYYDVDGDASNGCEVRDDRDGSKDDGGNQIYSLGMISNCGGESEYIDGRLPEDDKEHLPEQGSSADLFSFYYENTSAACSAFGHYISIKYRTYCNPDDDSQVVISIFSNIIFGSALDSYTIEGSEVGTFTPSGISTGSTYYVAIGSMDGSSYRGKYAIDVYADESEWDFDGWTDCSFD